MKLVVTENLKFLRIAEGIEDEIAQMEHSLNRKIRGFWYHPLVKKKCGMVPFSSVKIT